MRKIVWILLLAVLVASLVACDTGNTPDNPTQSTEIETTDPANPTNPTDPIETEPLKYSEGLEFTAGDGDYYIVSGVGNCSDSNIVIPNTYNNLPVTEIGASCFAYCNSIASVIIPDNITRIGDSAFERCTRLTDISIPDGVTEIGSDAFNHCTSLTAVKLPNNLTEISDYLFFWCTNLECVEIPDGVTSIGERAFFNCIKLNSVSIPASVKQFGGAAFGADNDMGDIAQLNVYITDLSAWCTIEFCDPYWGNVIGSAFCNPYNLYYNDELLTDLFIPNDVTRINEEAFHNCISITSVKISDSVTSMGYDAFAECPYLARVYIGKALATFEGWAQGGDIEVLFPDCDRLAAFIVDTENPNFSSDEKGLLYNKNKTVLLCVPAAIESTLRIPDGVEKIHYSAFDGCKKLAGIVLPKSLKLVMESAFCDCNVLANVYFEGTQSDWEKVRIEEWYNDNLTNATIHYNQNYM